MGGPGRAVGGPGRAVGGPGAGGYPDTVRRFPLAFLLVGLLGLLAAGGAVLGAFEAPTGADLAVHDGASATLQAGRVTGTYTTSSNPGVKISFAFRAPDHLAEVAHGPSGKLEGSRHVSGSQASGVLGPVNRLLSLDHFSVRGSYYDRTEPAKSLVSPAARAQVTGTYRTQVQLDGGYVVAVLISIHASKGSQHFDETQSYRLSRVGAWSRSR